MEWKGTVEHTSKMNQVDRYLQIKEEQEVHTAGKHTLHSRMLHCLKINCLKPEELVAART
jgi:hypothetical protein